MKLITKYLIRQFFDSVSDELICRKRLKINGLHKICLVDLQD